MSDSVNTNLMERAAEHVSYWEGEGIGVEIEQAVLNNDLERLYNLLKESTTLMYNLEFQDDDHMTPERAEQMYEEAMNVYKGKLEDGEVF